MWTSTPCCLDLLGELCCSADQGDSNGFKGSVRGLWQVVTRCDQLGKSKLSLLHYSCSMPKLAIQEGWIPTEGWPTKKFISTQPELFLGTAETVQFHQDAVKLLRRGSSAGEPILLTCDLQKIDPDLYITKMLSETSACPSIWARDQSQILKQYNHYWMSYGVVSIILL